MIRKGDCRKALEVRLAQFKQISSVEEETLYYHRCCGIVWFLEEIGVFDEDEAKGWIEVFAEESCEAWYRLYKEENK